MNQCLSSLTLIQSNLFMETVVLSYIVNNAKNCKGIEVYNFNLEFHSESLVINGGQNIEIIYPLNEITNIELNISNNEYKLLTSKGAHFLLTLT